MNRKRLTAAAVALVLGAGGVAMLGPSTANASGSAPVGQPSVHDGTTADESGPVSELSAHTGGLTAAEVAEIMSGLAARNAGVSQTDLNHEGGPPADAVDVAPPG